MQRLEHFRTLDGNVLKSAFCATHFWFGWLRHFRGACAGKYPTEGAYGFRAQFVRALFQFSAFLFAGKYVTSFGEKYPPSLVSSGK